MRETIVTVPLWDAFSLKQGCPVCGIERQVEEQLLAHVLGDAMMEPDVRLKTNQQGFCRGHYQRMLAQQKRLALGLILESHLKTLCNQKLQFPARRGLKKQAEYPHTSCYLCEKQSRSMIQITKNILVLYEQEDAFRTLFLEQEQICLPHLQSLLESAHQQKMRKPVKQQLLQACLARRQASLEHMLEDVSSFCQLFDYRNQNREISQNKDALQRCVCLLTGKEMPTK